MWNFSKSRSFANESQVFGWKNASGVNEINWNPNHFFFYDDLSLQMGSDVERIGDSHEARIFIQVADMHFQLPEAFPFTGVFGLSPAFPTDNGKQRVCRSCDSLLIVISHNSKRLL